MIDANEKTIGKGFFPNTSFKHGYSTADNCYLWADNDDDTEKLAYDCRTKISYPHNK